MGGGDCAVCRHPARDEIEGRILAGEPLKQILDDYNSPGAYHEPTHIGDRGWHEHQSLPLAYHEFVCMRGEKWPKPDAKKIMVKPIAADLPQESLENRKVWYVPPKPGEDCAKPYPEGTPGGYWREYPPESDIPDAKPKQWEGVNREPKDPGMPWIAPEPKPVINLDDLDESGFSRPTPERDAPCLKTPVPEARGEDGKRYRKYNPRKEEKLHQIRHHPIDKTDIIIHEPEPEESGDDDWIVDEMEMARPALSGSYGISKDAWGDIQHEPEHNTHSDEEFLKKRILYHHATTDAPPKTIDCSISNRERGYINTPGDLPDELSYPALCVTTFYDIPHIEDPPLPVHVNVKDGIIIHEEYKSSELAEINVKINELYGTIYPTTAKTIKKHRDQSITKPGIVPYAHQKYEGTPIGKLLEDHPTAGRAALNGIFNYFMMFFFEYYSLSTRQNIIKYAPTRQNIIKSFMNGPKVRGAKYPNKDLAESHFDLLEDYGVIACTDGRKNKNRKNKNHGLYYATQKSGPHQIPTGPHKSTREHYILNNKS